VSGDVTALGIHSEQKYFIVGYCDPTLNREAYDLTTGTLVFSNIRHDVTVSDTDMIVSIESNRYSAAVLNEIVTFEFDDTSTCVFSATINGFTEISRVLKVPSIEYLIIAGDSNVLIIQPMYEFSGQRDPTSIDLGFSGVSSMATFKSLRMVAVAGFRDDVVSLISLPNMKCLDPIATACELDGSESSSCIDNASISDDTCMCDDGYFFNEDDVTCETCDVSCETCTGGTASDCNSCGDLAEEEDGVCVCTQGFYFNSEDDNSTIPSEV
jgi:hypothetical protein